MSTQTLANLKTLFISLAPFVVPIIWKRGLRFYAYCKSEKYKSSIKPLSRRNQHILAIIIATSLFFPLLYYPLTSAKSPNIFHITDSRLQTPSQVIEARLTNIFTTNLGSKNESNTEQGVESKKLWDSALISAMPYGFRQIAKYATPDQWQKFFDRLSTTDGKLLYTEYGTDPFLNCEFCKTDMPVTFLIYSLPSISAPYLINMFMILITSTGPRLFLTTPQSAQWCRSFAVINLAGLAYILYHYYYFPKSIYFMRINKIALSRQDVYWFFEFAVKFNSIFLFLLDIVYAVCIWISGTGRAWDNTFSDESYYRSTQRIIAALDASVNRLRVSTLLHSNVIATNKEYRDAYEKWGASISAFNEELKADESVKEAIKNAKHRKGALFRNVEAEAKNLIERYL